MSSLVYLANGCGIFPCALNVNVIDGVIALDLIGVRPERIMQVNLMKGFETELAVIVNLRQSKVDGLVCATAQKAQLTLGDISRELNGGRCSAVIIQCLKRLIRGQSFERLA